MREEAVRADGHERGHLVGPRRGSQGKAAVQVAIQSRRPSLASSSGTTFFHEHRKVAGIENAQEEAEIGTGHCCRTVRI